jgi:hypothetical protein
MRYKNGDRFTGKFENGIQVEGEMLYSGMNESYIGQWKDGFYEG